MHPLNQSFEIPALQDWQERVVQDLKGRDFDRTLVTRTLEGLKIQPLYTQAPSAAEELPGQAPYRRGASALGGTRDLWEMRQPVSTAAHADEALRLGASAIAVSDPADLQAILSAVDSELAPVHLHGGASQSAEQALEWGLNGGLGISVATDLARDGGLPQSLDDAWRRASWALGAAPSGTLALAVDGSVFHHAGADEASDIALSLAAVAESLRALETLGHDPEQILAATELRVALDARMLLGIAKLRALRLCWSQLVRACGADVPPRIHAQLSARVQTRRDVWVNILRNSVAVFAGAVGGAQAISSLPFADCAEEDDQRLARRIARNTQLVLAQESHLARVIDPAGGAYALETWTQELAQAAWTQFQAIDEAGGLIASLKKGRIQSALQAVGSKRQRRISSRAQPITGVSEFPLVGERRPDTRGSVLGAVKDATSVVRALGSAGACSGIKPAGAAWPAATAPSSAMSASPSLASGTPPRGATIIIPFAAATRRLHSRRRSLAWGASPWGLKSSEKMKVRGAEPISTVRTNDVSVGGRRWPNRAGPPAPPGRPPFGVSRTVNVHRSKGKHSSAARELSGRMEIVGGRVSVDESERTTRLPREICHSSWTPGSAYVSPVARSSCDMR